MATLDSVVTKIRNLLGRVNSTTGKTDADLTSAVDRLISGYLPNGIIPSGTKSITTNGTHDVKNYANAQVNVQSGVTPSGTKTITANGDYDVTEFATASVNVPSSGITPTGSLTVTENGTFDVTNKASVVVNVPVPAQNFHVFPFALSSAWTGTAAEHTLLSGNAFVKEHYADEGFFAMWIPLGITAKAPSGTAMWVYQGNRVLAMANNTAYGVLTRSTGESSNVGWMPATAKLTGTIYNVSLRAKSNGNLTMYRSASYTIPAGNYLLLIGLAE